MKKTIGLYILGKDGKTPIPVDDTDAWGRWFESSRPGWKTELNGTLVSTIFLGLDHGFPCIGEPILWETMIFGDDEFEGYQERYSSYDDAMKGHELAVKFVKETPPQSPERQGHE